MNTVGRMFAVLGALVAGTEGVSAHHSYAMFDASRRLVVEGTVAKVEWQNPHVYVWVYVPNPTAPSGFDLYAFENAASNVLRRLGWTKTSLTVGEPIAVTYFPLRDGRSGGHFVSGALADGRTVAGAGGPGVHERLP